jgi:hypothetical protein
MFNLAIRGTADSILSTHGEGRIPGSRPREDLKEESSLKPPLIGTPSNGLEQ